MTKHVRTASGVETYYALPPIGCAARLFLVVAVSAAARRRSARRRRARVWRDFIQAALVERTRAVNRGIKSEQFYVIANVRHPAALVEGGFITNKSDVTKLTTTEYRPADRDGDQRRRASPLGSHPAGRSRSSPWPLHGLNNSGKRFVESPYETKLCSLSLALLLAGAGMLRADQTTSAVQQALKDQGFYYGEVTGEKTADTTAAIRRYQIRNGLQITGEIDAETLRSLGVGSGVARSTAQAQPTAAPEEETQATAGRPRNPLRFRRSRRPPTTHRNAASVTLMDRVPAQAASRGERRVCRDSLRNCAADLQRHVIVGAQTLLARYGYYWSGIDGEFGPGTHSAVRAVPSPRRSRAGRPPQHGNAGCPWFAPGSAWTGIPRAAAPAAGSADLPRRVGA